MSSNSPRAGAKVIGHRLLASCLLVALLVGLGPSTRVSAAQKLHVDPNYIYDYDDTVLRRFPTRTGGAGTGPFGTPADNVFRLSHDNYAKKVVADLEALIAPFESSGAYAETRGFIDADGSGFANIVALIPGSDPVLKNEYVIVGGHYDCTPTHVDGAIDCGMQVALTMGIVKAFVDYYQQTGKRPQRSLMVFFPDGEEHLLFGSIGFTTTDVYKGTAHLELPPQASVVAYHDTDMIGANYPGRFLGRSDLDFMPLNSFSAPSYDEEGTSGARLTRAWQPYTPSISYKAKYADYRVAMKGARDRLFSDMRGEFGHVSFQHRDGQTRPLFTDSQKKYINIIDDPLDRSDHSVFILQGVPAEINIGLGDPDTDAPGLLSYHDPGESLEFLNYMYSGQTARSAETLLGIETAAMWTAYQMGANHAEAENYFLGEM